jgi:hypothetical protein
MARDIRDLDGPAPLVHAERFVAPMRGGNEQLKSCVFGDAE